MACKHISMHTLQLSTTPYIKYIIFHNYARAAESSRAIPRKRHAGLKCFRHLMLRRFLPSDLKHHTFLLDSFVPS